MVGHGQVTVAILLTATAFLAVVPSGSSGVTSYCNDSTALGEPEPARCYLQHPTCSAGFCTWPDVHLRVWVDEGVEGKLTPIVTAAVHGGNHVVCQEQAEMCEGTYVFPFTFGREVQCDGYGPEDGAVLAITEVINAAWAVHMECWTE